MAGMLLNVEVTFELIERFRVDLSAAGFTVDNLEDLWGPDAAAALHRAQRVPALRAIDSGGGDDTALAALARVFVLGLPARSDVFESALPTLGLGGAVELGLVRVDEAAGMVVPLLDVRPYEFRDARGLCSWWIASDLGELALGHAIPERHVLGVGGASLTLAGLMVHSEVSSVLDLGTGCGIIAMHASRFAERVVATDISARALEIAALNARLNSISSIEFREGSLFEPVVGERFDRVFSNPPFVITPRTAGVPSYEYRDGGLEGDAIVELVIRGVDDHLATGGIAQLLGNWEYHGTTTAFERVGGWLDHSSLDAWVIEREVQSPMEYAETWIRDGGTKPGSAEFDSMYSAWIDDFDARGVTGVGFGYVTLRRPPEGVKAWRSLERLDGALGGALGGSLGGSPGGSSSGARAIGGESGLGAHIATVFAARDWLAGLDEGDSGYRGDDLLGRSVLTVAGDVTEERHYWPGDDDPTVITLRQGGGFARSVPAGTLIAAVVGACDGQLSVRAICAAVAQVLELDVEAVTAEVLPSIRELIVFGMLEPELA